MNSTRLLYLSAILISLLSCSSELKKEVNQPNILIAIADDASYPHMGAYGCRWVETPVFDKLAKEGVLFNNAYTSNAKCAPSRASLLTGRNSWQLEDAGNHLAYFPTKFKTFPETLSVNGFHVGYTGKGWAPGIALNKNGTDRDLLVNAYQNKKTTPPTTEISKNDYVENFKDFLKEKDEDKPFFFWFGGWEPHRAYEYGSGLRHGKKLSEIDKVFDFWPDVDSVRTDILDYAFELEYFDDQLGKILNVLEENGQLNNTVVIVTSDNGMPFPRVKGQEYEMSNHLPLAIMWKDGIKHVGRTIDDFISFIDIAPTILELAGVPYEQSKMKPITGSSLANILHSSKSGIVDPFRDHVLIGKERHDIGRPNNQGYPIRGIRKGDFLYLRNFKIDRWPSGNPETGYLNTDGSPTKTVILDSKNTNQDKYWALNFGKRSTEELFNIIDDPYCINNLADNIKFTSVKEEMAMQMEKELIMQNDPRILGNGDIFDNYKIYPTQFMDYYEKFSSGDDIPELIWVNKSDYRPNQSE